MGGGPKYLQCSSRRRRLRFTASSETRVVRQPYAASTAAVHRPSPPSVEICYKDILYV